MSTSTWGRPPLQPQSEAVEATERPRRKTSVAKPSSRKMSARMDSEVVDAFKLFDKVSYQSTLMSLIHV